MDAKRICFRCQQEIEDNEVYAVTDTIELQFYHVKECPIACCIANSKEAMEVVKQIVEDIRNTYAPISVTNIVHKAITTGILYSALQSLDAMFIVGGKDRAELKRLQFQIIGEVNDILKRNGF